MRFTVWWKIPLGVNVLLDNGLNPSNRVLQKLTDVQVLSIINDLYDVRDEPGVA